MKEKILEAMRRMPVIDSHAHIPEEEKRGTDMLSVYTGQYLGHDLITAGMPPDEYAALSNPEILLTERANLLNPWLEKVKFTSYYRCVNKSAQIALGVKGFGFTSFDDADRAFRKNLKPGYYESVFKSCGIKRVLIDHTGLDWDFRGDVYAQSFNTVHLFGPYNEHILRKIEGFSGVRIRGFETYLAACESLLRKKAESQNVRVLKFPTAYTRRLSFPQSAYGEAEKEFNGVYAHRIQYREAITSNYNFDGQYLFQNYLMHRILSLAEELNLVCQFHTGLLAGHNNFLPNANPAGIIPLAFQYPGVRFDIFHMAYPYQGELCAMAKNYPNIYVNICWAHIISPYAVRAALSEWLDILPSNKIIGFGSDVNDVDLITGSLEMARENIAAVLAEKVRAGLMGFEDAEALGEDIVFNNGAGLYGWKYL